MTQNSGKQKYSKEALKDIRTSITMILDMYTETMQAILNGDELKVKNVQKKKDEIMQLDEKMRRAHIERVGKKKCKAIMTAGFNNILHDIERMGNSCVNLIEIALQNVDNPLLLN